MRLSGSRKLRLAVGAATASLALAGGAQATAYVVDAKGNSSSGGVGAATISLTSGQNFHVAVASTDLWNAGSLPRWANADGLVNDLFATGSDDSGYAAGVQIGAHFVNWTQGGLTAPYDSLVGKIGSVYRFLGTNFSGPAWDTGTLSLYFWDENNGDNTQFITAKITTDIGTSLPEPVTWVLMIAGFGLVGLSLRRLSALNRAI